MSVTVSDAGPLIHLAQISKLQLLKQLFKRVLITSGVRREVVDKGIKLGYEDALLVKEAIGEGWIIIQDITAKAASTAKKLAEGENVSTLDAEALLLAKEHEAKNFLVDDKILSSLAKMYGFNVWNTWTILLEALSKGFIELTDIESAIDELGEQRHKLKAEQAAEILKAAKHLASRKRD
ncbi:MAG: hypothetical protein Q6364_10270 [Candidatus Hermodarchaeota archaeon]|nr:hypothetical protein [Candidatus Hermodarchaeota archaeon]